MAEFGAAVLIVLLPTLVLAWLIWQRR